MILSLSSLAYQALPLEQLLPLAADLGCKAVELNSGTDQLPVRGVRVARLRALRQQAADLGLQLLLHASALDLNPLSLNGDLQNLTLDHYERGLEQGAELGAETVTVHIGSKSYGAYPDDAARDRLLEFAERLLSRANGAGYPALGWENTAWGSTDPFPTPSSFQALQAVLPEPSGFTLDVGHAAIAGLDPVGTAAVLGPRLRNVHLHDNDGSTDWHWAVGRGSLPLRSWLGELHALGYSGPITYEFVDPDPAPAVRALGQLLADVGAQSPPA